MVSVRVTTRMLSVASLHAVMQQYSLNTTAVCIGALHSANASLQNLAVGGVALCKMANAESCQMKNSFTVVLHL